VPRLNPGDSPQKGPLNAQAWNRVDAAGEAHEARARGLALPVKPNWQRNWHTVAQVQNDTGVDLRAGEVLEFDGFLLNSLDNTQLWFSGKTPNLTRIGWAVLLDPALHLADGPQEVVPCLVYGICGAHVLITDADHRYAERVADSRVLRSCARGPVKLLEIPTGGALPEERWCAVQLQDEGGDYVDCVQVYHSGEPAYAVVEANADGVHPGLVKRVISETMTEIAPCWILFVDQYDTNVGNVPAINTDYYGPARYSGTYTVGETTLDLLVVRRGYQWAEDLIHFELLAELVLAGHAAAKLLEWNGTAWVDSGEEIEVYDWYDSPGMWNGYTGYRGWAKYRDQVYTDPGEDAEDPEDDEERNAADIVWMERPAQQIRFTTTGYMTAGAITATVDYFDHQGRDPGNSVTVYDPGGLFPDVASGAKGLAYYNNKAKRYEIHEAHRVAKFATATLVENTCGTNGEISGFTIIAEQGEFILAPPTAPTSFTGGIIHGLAGDTVTLVRTNNAMPEPAWRAIRVTKHEVSVLVDVQITGLELQKKHGSFFVELCETEEEDWLVWHTATECPEP